MSQKNSPLLVDTHEAIPVSANTPAETDSWERYGGMIDGHIPLSDIAAKDRGNVTDQMTSTGAPGLSQSPPRGNKSDDLFYLAAILTVLASATWFYLLLR